MRLALYIQGVPESIDYFSRGDRGTPDEQKIIWERGIWNATLGRYGQNTGFCTNFTKKILKNQGCILKQSIVLQSCSQLNELSNSVHNASVYCSFQAVKVYQSRNFNFFYPFFDFGGHFGIKKGPIDLCFSHFFQNPCKISFKMVVLTLYSENSSSMPANFIFIKSKQIFV